ncbi:MAG: spondin domain-containing protein [Bacteroidota bacterium]
MKFRNLILFSILCSFVLVGCSNDDDEDPVATTQTFRVTVENISTEFEYFQSGMFNTPVNATTAGPAMPGNAYEFSFNAGPGHKLSFATMFVQSNDLFYAPSGDGIELFNNGTPVTGDITAQVQLWDSGTEVNEEPGVGMNQAPRQSGPNTGADENGTVREISAVADGFTYPAVSDNIRVTLSSTGDNAFTVRIENLSASNTPLAPGVYVVHSSSNPLFEEGAADRDQGLEALAEDGDASGLATWLGDRSGVTSPLAPGVWAVHGTGNPLFTTGTADLGEGLEALAEDGSPDALATSLESKAIVTSSGAFNTPVGASAAGPLMPGNSYEFTFTATQGEFLSFATMYVQSNDLFYSPGMAGIALWNGDSPISGDITSQLRLWDPGTEVNQFPGAGADQAPRQSGPNTGAAENGTVQPIENVTDGFTYQANTDVIRVTVNLQ